MGRSRSADATSSTIQGSTARYTATRAAPAPPGGYTHLGQQSLAKYYEYSIVAPGAFGGGHVATGSSDGLYQLDLWANNVASNFAGFSDQSYLLEASKAGEHYFSFAWDQTPHVYSTSALTPLAWGRNQSSDIAAGPRDNAIASHGGSAGYINIIPYLHPIDLGNPARHRIVRIPVDTHGSLRTVNAYYSHMDRTGTQAAGIVEFDGFQPTQVPAPVNDTTQNFGASGEYLGNNLWGQYTFKAGV